jgi:hypothetical protein
MNAKGARSQPRFRKVLQNVPPVTPLRMVIILAQRDYCCASLGTQP